MIVRDEDYELLRVERNFTELYKRCFENNKKRYFTDFEIESELFKVNMITGGLPLPYNRINFNMDFEFKGFNLPMKIDIYEKYIDISPVYLIGKNRTEFVKFIKELIPILEEKILIGNKVN